MTERREFIKTSLVGAAGITIGGIGMSAKSYGSIMGANERINVAVIGYHGQGGTHIRSWCNLKDSHNVFLKTLCDVDEQFYAAKAAQVEKAIGTKPLQEWDMRKVFDDKDIHAVSCAIPNHWHALATVWAAQAGKNVYIEKPACHNIFEGRKMVEAARKYNVRVQTGFQNRSIANVMQAIKFLHDGGIGDVYMAKGMCYKPRDSFGIAPDSMPPASLHYDMWLGPATWRPYNEKKGHYNWHWFWATGGGDTANQGPHQFDIARWGLNKNEHPVSVYSTGGIYGIDPKECAQETPNTQSSLFTYADGKVLEFETRGRYTNGEASLDVKIGNIFYGTDGYLELNGSRWNAYKQRGREPFAGSSIKTEETAQPAAYLAAPGGATHYANFLDAIRSGSNYDLHCDINDGFYSSALPLLANISYRLKRELHFMGQYEKFADDPEADMMLSRNYRKPYVVPENV